MSEVIDFLYMQGKQKETCRRPFAGRLGARKMLRMPIRAYDRFNLSRAYGGARRRAQLRISQKGASVPDETQVPKRRPLHFIWIVDCSGSMKGLKLAAVNRGIRSSTAPLRQAAAAAVEADIRVRAVTFGWGARWHFDQPTELQRFDWRDVAADGVSDMGAAMALTAEAMAPDVMPAMALPPVCVLISDGLPTDDFGRGLQVLLDQPAGARSVRAAVAVGADADTEFLTRFVGGAGLHPVVARNVVDLEAKVAWVAIHSLHVATANPKAPLQPLPSDMAPRSARDVF